MNLTALNFFLFKVQILVISDKSLSRDHCRAHSPLHLAARNGHTAVLEALLDAGMSVDTMVPENYNNEIYFPQFSTECNDVIFSVSLLAQKLRILGLFSLS